jgi:hypothetical protein
MHAVPTAVGTEAGTLLVSFRVAPNPLARTVVSGAAGAPFFRDPPSTVSSRVESTTTLWMPNMTPSKPVCLRQSTQCRHRFHTTPRASGTFDNCNENLHYRMYRVYWPEHHSWAALVSARGNLCCTARMRTAWDSYPACDTIEYRQGRFSRPTVDSDDWAPRLNGVDVVVNAVGSLRGKQRAAPSDAVPMTLHPGSIRLQPQPRRARAACKVSALRRRRPEHVAPITSSKKTWRMISLRAACRDWVNVAAILGLSATGGKSARLFYRCCPCCR